MTGITDLSLESKATVYGEMVNIAGSTGTPIEYVAGTTYNELLDILPQEHIGTTKIPKIAYVGIGIGSDHMESIVHPTGGQVIENPTNYIHRNQHAVPFIPIPFLLREVGSDDLTSLERSKYAQRAIMLIDGKSYVGYFLHEVNLAGANVSLRTVVTDASGNVTSVDPVEPSTEPLSPTRDPNFLGESESSNDYLRVRAPIKLNLSPSEIDELLNVAAIMFGVSDIEITEFSLVAAIDVDHVVTDGENTITYREVIGAQSTHFTPLSFSASQRAGVGIDIEFQLGQSLPKL